MSVWLASLLCLALADDPAFVEGQRLYRAFEYEQAIFRFQEIAVRPQVTSADRAEALVWLGLSYAGTGDLEAARRNFKDALTLQASVALPANVSPRVAALFNEERAALTPPPPPPPNVQPPDAPPPDAPPADAPPPDVPPDAPPATDGHASPLLVPGAVLAGVGGVALVAGVVLAVLASGSYADATDPAAFQDDAKAALDRANAEAIGAGVALPLGALIAGGGVAMLIAALALE